MLYFTLDTTKLHKINTETGGSDTTDEVLECFKGKYITKSTSEEKHKIKGYHSKIMGGVEKKKMRYKGSGLTK